MMDPTGAWAAGYRALHAVYDSWQASYGIEYSRRILPRLLRTLERHRPVPGSAIDLGCGTGTMVLLLEQRGWSVSGIDASPGMIDGARAKAAAAGSAAHFETGDLRTFTLPRPVDLALSLYDVLNHLPAPEDLLQAAGAVRRALGEGGIFVFDMNNDRCYRRLWTRDETITVPEYVMTLENSYDHRSGVAVSRVHVKFNDGREEIRETVLERCFTRGEIAAALTGAGLALLEAEDIAFPGAPWAGKLKTWYVAGG